MRLSIDRLSKMEPKGQSGPLNLQEDFWKIAQDGQTISRRLESRRVRGQQLIGPGSYWRGHMQRQIWGSVLDQRGAPRNHLVARRHRCSCKILEIPSGMTWMLDKLTEVRYSCKRWIHRENHRGLRYKRSFILCRLTSKPKLSGRSPGNADRPRLLGQLSVAERESRRLLACQESQKA